MISLIARLHYKDLLLLNHNKVIFKYWLFTYHRRKVAQTPAHCAFWISKSSFYKLRPSSYLGARSISDRAECKCSHFFEIDLGSIHSWIASGGGLRSVQDRCVPFRAESLVMASENANTSWKRSSLVAFPHWESRKPTPRAKNACKKRENGRDTPVDLELLSLLRVIHGFEIK